MALFGRRSSPTVHWSKDFIEHLRTVHFTLIVLAIVAIISGRGPDLTKMRIARNQLTTIRDFLETKLPMYGKHLVTETGDWLLVKGKNLAMPYPATEVVLVTVRCDPPVSRSGRNDNELWLSDLLREWSVDWPSTLHRFSQIWNLLNCADLNAYDTTAFVDSLYPLNYQRPTSHLQRVIANRDDLIKSKTQVEGLLLEDNTLTKPFEEHVKWVQELPSGHGGYFRKTFVYSVGHDASRGRLVYGLLVVSALKVGESAGHDELNKLESTWVCKAQYSHCFSELSDIVAGKEDYTLKDLAVWLDEQITTAEPRQIDLFGIRFPADSQAQWGIILIVTVLLYFWMHLRELSPRLKADHSGLEVAWPGLYRSWIAYAVVWVTVVFVPLYALRILGLNRVHYKSPWRSFVIANWRDVSLWLAVPLILYCILSVSSCLKLRQLALLADAARQKDESELPEEESASAAKASAD